MGIRALSQAIDGTPALRRSAVASHPVALLRELVIVSQFLSCSDLSQTEQQQVPFESPQNRVRAAAVVDQFGPASSH
jgi:hypothetical protein